MSGHSQEILDRWLAKYPESIATNPELQVLGDMWEGWVATREDLETLISTARQVGRDEVTAAVLAEHPAGFEYSYNVQGLVDYCTTCDKPWPCATVRSLAPFRPSEEGITQ